MCDPILSTNYSPWVRIEIRREKKALVLYIFVVIVFVCMPLDYEGLYE